MNGKKGFTGLLFVIGVMLLTSCGQSKNAKDPDRSETQSQSASGERGDSAVAQELKKRIDDQDTITIVDTRSLSDYALSHVPGAINIPQEDLADKASSILLDKNADIYVYCGTEDTSLKAADYLTSSGYDKVHNMGSFNNWDYETSAPVRC